MLLIFVSKSKLHEDSQLTYTDSGSVIYFRSVNVRGAPEEVIKQVDDLMVNGEKFVIMLELRDLQ